MAMPQELTDELFTDNFEFWKQKYQSRETFSIDQRAAPACSNSARAHDEAEIDAP